MDYKYIEQLLERYWNAQTTLEEEAILRAFFLQDDIPANMLHYKVLFTYEASSRVEDTLDENFDEKMIDIVEYEEQDSTIKNSLYQSLRPLLRAVACVCAIVVIGTIINHTMQYGEKMENMNTAQVVDTMKVLEPSMADVNLADSSRMDINN